jgi:hypothetical protein
VGGRLTGAGAEGGGGGVVDHGWALLTVEQADYNRAMSDPWSLKAAAFVIQVLELEADPVELAGAMSPLKREPAGGTTAVELSSSGGPTPFLIYHYALVPGMASPFEADVATMEQAERLNTPGPRIIASASSDTEAYILATTPHVQRMLAGEPARPDPPLPDATTADRQRRETPGKLIDAIRVANGLAAEWLGALKVAPSGPATPS